MYIPFKFFFGQFYLIKFNVVNSNFFGWFFGNKKQGLKQVQENKSKREMEVEEKEDEKRKKKEKIPERQGHDIKA